MTSNWNKNSPSVKIHATVTSSEGYDYENLSKVRGNFIPSTLKPSKISMLVISHAVMGRVRFMFYPCFFCCCCCCFVLFLFLFLFFFCFVLFLFCLFFCLFVFVGNQTQTSPQPNFESGNLWCLFAKSCWNINTRTLLRILFLYLCIIYIFFWFYRSVGFEVK